ncbi:PTPA-CTERM sorting domain-containing protein [Pseudanabaena sp. FACHB-2040]|uniref:PTPA-CTERM sorting domain-containing protein n=1 Tax=Pseudanabaena sp. FACHB-2040 TaxID=2692859 RepID=UPI001685231F|nr:PTPA-CTERM sorting domain-containing protein [Pseudanabaena sp. FACHB-2040]MBD2260584.1 PTPA-CTERM sorting domain-containing protein [Pseudanabaena sp. FACHB-2040]
MMSTTQSFKNLALSVTMAGTAASMVLMGADPASALTFKINANIFESSLSPTTSVGKLTGSFDYDDVNGYSNIKITSDLLDRDYDGLVPGLASNGVKAWFSTSESTPSLQSLLKLEFASNLGSARFGDTISLVGGGNLDSFEGVETPAPFPFRGSAAFLFPLEGSVTAVPTPALLPGLIGMGLTALRKRRDDSEESAED